MNITVMVKSIGVICSAGSSKSESFCKISAGPEIRVIGMIFHIRPTSGLDRLWNMPCSLRVNYQDTISELASGMMYSLNKSENLIIVLIRRDDQPHPCAAFIAHYILTLVRRLRRHLLPTRCSKRAPSLSAHIREETA